MFLRLKKYTEIYSIVSNMSRKVLVKEKKKITRLKVSKGKKTVLVDLDVLWYFKQLQGC